MLKSMPAHIGHCGPKSGWGLKNIFKLVGQSLLLVHENKPKHNKGISKRFCWQQLFGLLYNITISLKSIRPNKTAIISEKKDWYISPTRARTFSFTTLWPLVQRIMYQSVPSLTIHSPPPPQNHRAIFLMGKFPIPRAKKEFKTPTPWAYKNELKPHLWGISSIIHYKNMKKMRQKSCKTARFYHL